MANEDLKQSVLCNLRSVTQSCKGGVPFSRLQSDYEFLIGSPIPYKDLGFNSLEAFIRSIPDVISLRKENGQLLAEGVADSSTAHIVNMVKKQKEVKRKINPRKPTPHFGMRRAITSRYTFRGGYRPQASYPPRTSSSWNTPKNQYQTSAPSRPAPAPSRPAPAPSRPAPAPSRPAPAPSRPAPAPSRPTPAPLKPAYTSAKPVQASSKPNSNDQVPPIRKSSYEVPPRFLNKHRQDSSSHPQVKSQVQSSEQRRVPSPAVSPAPSPLTLEDEDEWGIPAPRIPQPVLSRTIPNRPKHVENTQTAQLSCLEATRTAKEFINVYCQMNNMKPDYKTNVIGQKAKTKGYVSLLTIGDKKYQLYPDSEPSAEAAEEEVASRAREDIKNKMQDQINSYPETPYGTAEEVKLLLGRIEEIVCEKPSGMFEHGILQEYENNYNERLPLCWPELLKKSCYVEIDPVSLVNGKVPKGANFIVRPTKELSSGNRTPSSTSSKTEIVNECLDTSALKKNLVDISYPNVPDMVLPPGNIWYVYVTNVVNTISVRFIDYNDDFIDLSQKMSDFYKMRNLPVSEVLENQMYAACDELDPNVWHRVLVDSIEDDNLVCYFVDVGEFLYVKKENLQDLSPAFLKLPFQAIHINLDGLDGFESSIELFEEKIYGQSLVAVVKRSKKFPEFFPDIPGIHRNVHSVTLFDTETKPGDDININQLILDTINESLVCKIPKLHSSCCGYLSHVTLEGLVYLRFRSPLTCLLERAMEHLSPLFEEASSSVIEVPLIAMCAAKYGGETWHRAVLSEIQPVTTDPDLVEVFFVDYGHTELVKKTEVCPLEPINCLLATFAYQAFCVELFDVLPSATSVWTDRAIAKLLEFAPFEQELMITVVQENELGLPKVNLFKRDEKGMMLSLNASLKYLSSLFDESLSLPIDKPLSNLSLQPSHSSQNTLSNAIPDVAVPAEQVAKRLGASVSSEDLKWLNTPDDIKSPEAFDVVQTSLDLVAIPEVGSYFDVYVTMAAHPHNFFVQPLSSYTELNKMMDEMKKLYSAEFASDNHLEMDIPMLRKNEFYAALHSDGDWYRIKVKDILQLSIIAYYVDFGDFYTVSISNIQPLYRQFKSLPCQAIKASLHGVAPLAQDWTPHDCVAFQKMVTDHIFVSVIHKKVVEDTDDIPKLCVELTLIDTSDSEQDIFIHENLIRDNIARPVKNAC